MEALSRKAEKEKLAELEAMLADATLSGDMTDDDSSVSFASEAPTPPNRRTPARTSQENIATTTSLASRSSGWIRSGDTHRNNSQNSTHLLIDNSIAGGGGAADVTTRIYSSSTSSSAEGSADEMEELAQQGHDNRTRRRGRSRLVSRKASSSIGRRQKRAELDKLVASLRSELSMARSQLEQKSVVTRSLQRQLDQRGEIEAQMQARAEEDLVAALAKASGVKEELERTSQLLVDGALERQHLEQRCSLLAQDLHKSFSRTAELDAQVSEMRAELVRISGALHARRGTDVVDAERAFGEELQRVQETAMREARALKLEARGLRVSLDETTAKFRKACEERDSWREEAEVLASEANSLRETVTALRQYSENDTIDQLLGQVSRWKHRAEELERLPRVSLPSRSLCSESNSDNNVSHCMGSGERLSPFQQQREEGGVAPDTECKATISLATPEKDEKAEEKKEVMREGGRERVIASEEDALRQELLEARGALVKAGEEASTALLAAREEARMRIAVEGRVKSLEKTLEVNARAAKESLVARRAAKARALNDLKAAIQQEMGAELDSLRRELEEQRQAEKSLAAAEVTTCGCPVAADMPTGVDKSCPISSIVVVAKEGGIRTDESASINTASTFCGTDSGRLTTDDPSVVASPQFFSAEEAEKRVAMAVAAVAAAEAGAAAWTRAFFSAKRTVYAALISLCEHAAGLRGAEGSGEKALALPLLTEVKAWCAESSCDRESSAVVPWLPAGEVSETEPTAALEALQRSVESAVEDMRAALTGHVSAVQPGSVQRSTNSTGSQTTPLSLTTSGSQTKAEEGRGEWGKGDAVESERGTTPGRIDRVGVVDRVGVRGEDRFQAGAPAWDGGSPGPKACSERHHRDEQGKRQRRQSEDAASVEELRRKEGALRKALQRTEVDKRNLERSLTRRFERETMVELQRQRVAYEQQISDLHASIMLLARDVGTGLVA